MVEAKWVRWSAAIAIAAIGIALYLVWPSDWTWWVGVALATLFAVFVVFEAKKKGYRGGDLGGGDDPRMARRRRL